MERRYAAALLPGEQVDETFALLGKELRAARTGEAYLALELSDRSGRIPGIMFRPGREATAIPTGVVARVRGTVTQYRGVVRVSVESLRPADSYDPGEILASGTRDAGELVAELRDLLRAVSDRGLSALVRAVFGDADLMARFKASPASDALHHAYLGGLLEHTVGVARVCRQLSSIHEQLDGDLLLTGALLHDVGVVDELDYETGIVRTNAGRLVGHAILGERRIRAALEDLGGRVPEHTALALAHMVLSHHADGPASASGQPLTLEALALHRADALDAQIAGFTDAAMRAGAVGECWTAEANPFGRSLRAPCTSDGGAETPQSVSLGLVRSA